MNLAQWIVIILSFIIGIWYFGAFLYNRQRGEVTYQWLKAGLRPLGELGEVQRLGTLTPQARLVIHKAEAPFQQIEVIFSLEPRENLPLWIFSHLQGRRDEIVIRASLRVLPTQEIETAHTEDRRYRNLVASEQIKPFELLPTPYGFEIARRGKPDVKAVERLKLFLERYGKATMRISLHRKEPHLVLQANLSSLLPLAAQEYFTSLCNVLVDPHSSVLHTDK